MMSLLLPMKTELLKIRRGFTLVEVLVVMAIMAILMTMAGSVLQEAGKGRGIDSAVIQLEGFLREAQATAIGNDTQTRVVILEDKADDKHLRFVNVMMLRKDERTKGDYDGSNLQRGGRWVSTSGGGVLPPGVFFSPYYSRPIRLEGRADAGSMIGNDSMHLAGRGTSRVYYIEFDEKGRFVSPMADPSNPTQPQRIVVMQGKKSNKRTADNGIEPRELDNKRRPVGAKGLVIWPGGDTSRLRTLDQLEVQSNRRLRRN